MLNSVPNEKGYGKMKMFNSSSDWVSFGCEGTMINFGNYDLILYQIRLKLVN